VEIRRKGKTIYLPNKELTVRLKISLKDLRRSKRRNHKSNLAFIRFYADYMKKKSNKEWSSEQKRFLEMLYKTSEEK
jgi:hypothetical protein